MKPLYKTIKVTDKTQTQKLPIIQQLKLLLGKVSNDDTARLESNEKLSRANMEIKSSFSNFINEVTREMRENGFNSVTIKVNSRFKPFFKEVLSPEYGKGRFYNFTILKDDGETVINQEYFIIMRIDEKEM